MPNLILLHGALGHSNIFNPYLKTLSQYFSIHMPLFSGHGPSEGISIEKYTQELTEIAKKIIYRHPYFRT